MRGTIRFGFATDTFDAEGTAAAEPQPLTCSLEELRELAARFRGEIDQVPPVYSAKKINGVAAHKLARAGAEVPVKPARITIHDFQAAWLCRAMWRRLRCMSRRADMFARWRMSWGSLPDAERIWLRCGGRGRECLR